MKLPTKYVAVAMLLSSVALVAPALANNAVIDGTLDANYGIPLATQTTQTQFGNSNLGVVDNANGSELDLGFAIYQNGILNLFLAGNLESNFNKIEVFIDSRSGGQNRLLGNNPNVDFDGLNRMGDSGTGNGLKFDAGFDADYWISITGGGGPYQLYANAAELLTAGGGTGGFLGQTGAASSGVLTGGTNPNGIKVTIHNGNSTGVDGGCAVSSGAGVTRGIEFEIPAAAIGNPTGPIRVCAFVNGGGHDFLANQVLGPIPSGTCNLGEPRAVDFGAIAGNQYFTISEAPVVNPLMLSLMSLVLLAGAVVILRRRSLA